MARRPTPPSSTRCRRRSACWRRGWATPCARGRTPPGLDAWTGRQPPRTRRPAHRPVDRERRLAFAQAPRAAAGHRWAGCAALSRHGQGQTCRCQRHACAGGAAACHAAAGQGALHLHRPRRLGPKRRRLYEADRPRRRRGYQQGVERAAPHRAAACRAAECGAHGERDRENTCAPSIRTSRRTTPRPARWPNPTVC